MDESAGIDIGVIGTGYLGAVHAVCLADLGHNVVGIDVDPAKIAGLSAGVPDFFEPGLGELLARTLATGRLTFSTDYASLAGARVVFLCVGTPQVAGGAEADTSYLFDAARSLAPYVDEHCLVVGKSTVPVGTAPRLALAMAEQARHPVRMAWNPEFLREGHAIQDTQLPSRLVYGVDPVTAAQDAELLDRVYAHPIADGVPRVVTDIATAELVKGSANAFLATKISFINAVADICERTGANVSDLAAALGLDNRIGPSFLGAGVGFGGGCLPKDIRAFAARAEELGVDQAAALLRVVDEINLGRRTKVVERATEMLGGMVRDKQIGILGFAFKPDSDDTRDAPALAIAAQLVESGAIVRLHDPRAPAPKVDAAGLSVAVSAHDAVADADLVLHITEWAEYRALDPTELRTIVGEPNILDARNRLDAGAWRAAGWNFRSLGLPGD